MMSEDQVEIVRLVYTRFMENETGGWTKIDDILELIEYLSEAELIKESQIKLKEYSKGIRCTKNHDHVQCFAPLVLEAVGAILSLGGELHPNNAYILSYFLALIEMGMIYSM